MRSYDDYVKAQVNDDITVFEAARWGDIVFFRDLLIESPEVLTYRDH